MQRGLQRRRTFVLLNHFFRRKFLHFIALLTPVNFKFKSLAYKVLANIKVEMIFLRIVNLQNDSVKMMLEWHLLSQK